jgi:hypothetical protein
MYLQALFTFLAIQLISLALWQGVHAYKKSNDSPMLPLIPKTTIHDINHEAAFTLNHVRFSAKDSGNKFRTLSVAKKEELIKTLQKLPLNHTSALKNLILDYNPNAQRGLGGKSLIILRAVNMSPEEFNGVMIHEIGHNVDLGAIKERDKSEVSEFKDGKTSIYEGDASLDFYRISWINDKTRKKYASNLDFVSGYAMTDPFEDFAETYVYYVLHNKEFKSKTQTSTQLFTKYEFMRDTVFQGYEFDTGTYLTEKLIHRPWDITALSYDLEGFLTS